MIRKKNEFSEINSTVDWIISAEDENEFRVILGKNAPLRLVNICKASYDST
ncbi:hypothetical protein [Leptospira alstonii]|uniref:hypothetical protein n=1 Tax=Leptospira alstonii TaxID=28452 RepID=UPI0012DD201E|nr:hypothetical protein [Leptospira alstonii]